MRSEERAERIVETELGTLTVRAGPEGVREVSWGPVSGPAAEGRDDGREGGASPTSADGIAGESARQLEQYARGDRRSFDLPLALPDGPPFRRRVLEELAAVPFGDTVSYGDLAERCGRPGAARAVGNAVGRNPLAVVLPCHRVVRADGSPGEYGGGRQRKRALLRLEGALPETGTRCGP